MHSSPSSSSASDSRSGKRRSFLALAPDTLGVRIATWFVREITGAVFIFSGITKAIDPWGTLYKMQDYLSVMGLDVWPSLVKVAAFILCAVEFIIGVMLCFGSFRRTAAWGAAALMCFMLPLTLWIALSDPVPDCGCFGDAFILTNWQTFWKNVVLMAAVIWLSFFNKAAGWLIAPYLQWIALVVTSFFIMAVEGAGYFYQPLIDFRPYPAGTRLAQEEQSAEPEYRFIYEKDGVRREFAETDSLPDEDTGWTFIDRVETSGIDTRVTVRHENDLRIWDLNGEEDITEEVLAPEGDLIILVMPELEKVSIASTWKINSLFDWAKTHGIEMVALISAPKEEIADWQDLSMPEYPIYTAEDTVLKELVRGNPGVVFSREGVIQWKSTLRALNTDDFMSPETSPDPLSFKRNDRLTLLNIAAIYFSVMAFLVGLSFFFRMRAIRKALIDDGKAPREE